MVGKTAICTRFAADKFDERYEPTYESSFRTVFQHHNQAVELNIRDTQGMSDDEIFRNEVRVSSAGVDDVVGCTIWA